MNKKRVTILTDKCLKSPDVEVGVHSKKHMKKQHKIASIKGKQSNVQKLLNLKKRKFTKNTLFGDEHSEESLWSDDSDEDPDVIPKKLLKQSEETISNIKTKYSSLKQKYQESEKNLKLYKHKLEEAEKKIKQYAELNIKLQNDVINTLKEMTGKNDAKNRNQQTSKTAYLPIQPTSSTYPETSIKTPEKLDPYENLQSPFKYLIGSRKCTDNSTPKEKSPIITPSKTTPPSKTSPELRAEIDQAPLLNLNEESEDFSLPPDKLCAAKYNIKVGVAGDSQYAKNLAAAIWPPEVLGNRSVSGRAPKKGSNLEEKKRLTPKKFEYLKDLCRKRLTEEDTSVSGTEIALRMKNIPKFLSEKIMTLNRVQKV